MSIEASHPTHHDNHPHHEKATRQVLDADGQPDHDLAVRIRGLNHTFGEGELKKQVLFNNNLELTRGEIVIMTGPSGSGKTTLLTLLGGLRTVQQGSMEVMGREMRGLSAQELVEARRSIGFIFQAHNLFASLTAQENVRMALELAPIDRPTMDKMAAEMLTALGLGHRITYKPSSLSGGQRQRVAIARAGAKAEADSCRRTDGRARQAVGPRRGRPASQVRARREVHHPDGHARQSHP